MNYRERFVKNFLMNEYKLNGNIFLQNGNGENDKTFKIEYAGKIELEYKKVTRSNDEFDIYLSDEIEENSCITVQIDKKLKLASIHGISVEKKNCFNHADFLLKRPGSFYLEMTLKLLKKYKDKFNINKITLIDNAQILCVNRGKFNLSQLLLLSEGVTWYEKYGFKITDKLKRKIVEKSKEVLKEIKVQDIDFDTIFDEIKKDKDYKIIHQDTITQIKKLLKENNQTKLQLIMYHIFNENRSNDTCLLYSLINKYLIRQIETKFKDFTRLEQLEYYLHI